LAGQPTLAGLSVFYPAPGSVDYRRCAALELLPSDPALLRSTALPIAHTTRRLETATLLRLTRILNFLKGLTRQGEAWPRPAAPDARIQMAHGDRTAIGRKLISWFFHDGVIRGLTPDGEVFPHPTSGALCREFLTGLPRPIPTPLL
jgi:hypothetical protein